MVECRPAGGKACLSSLKKENPESESTGLGEAQRESQDKSQKGNLNTLSTSVWLTAGPRMCVTRSKSRGRRKDVPAGGESNPRPVTVGAQSGLLPKSTVREERT